MKSMSFQTIILGVFGFLVVGGMLIFAGVIPIGKSSSTTTYDGTTLSVWGTIPEDTLRSLLAEFSQSTKMNILYSQHNAQTFDTELIDALASATGPDIIIGTQETLIKQRTKLLHIPYDKYPEGIFRDSFVQEGELFLLPDGILAFPLAIDPLILYYNRVMFENEGLLAAPTTWEEVTEQSKKLTKLDQNQNIDQSAIAFGKLSNIQSGKDILSMLLLQAGNGIIKQIGTVGAPLYRSTLEEKFNFETAPAVSVLSFFTQFADPLKDTYSWNKILPNSYNAFISEELAQYIGYASELPQIVAKNPNLNFNVAMVPQIKDTRSKMTFGRMWGVAVIKNSRNQVPAFIIAQQMAGADFSKKFVDAVNANAPIAPARRDLLKTFPGTLYGPVLYNSAIIARGWFDPDSGKTYPIFSDLVNNVISGVESIEGALGTASNKLTSLFQ